MEIVVHLIPSNARQECVATTLTICWFSGLCSSLLHSGLRSSCGHKSVLAICVFLSYKRSVGNIISVKTMVRRLPDLPRQPCPREMIVRETVLLNLFKVQSSNSRKKWGGLGHPSCPASDSHASIYLVVLTGDGLW